MRRGHKRRLAVVLVLGILTIAAIKREHLGMSARLVTSSLHSSSLASAGSTSKSMPSSTFVRSAAATHDPHNNKNNSDTNNNTFSACLMWMDDNFRLYEWMAYHYYMIHLRFVVIHPDPASKTTPRPVLDLWRDRVRIVEWTHLSNFTNATYEVDETNDPVLRNNPGILARRREAAYVKRQLDFYHGCARYLQSQNRTWTTFQDNDEFVVATKAANVSVQDIQLGQPGVLLRVIQKYSAKRDDPDVVSRYFQSDPVTQFREWDLWFSARPCVSIARVLIGAAPSSESDVRRGVPDFLDPHRFDTFRWRYQSTPRTSRNDPGKSFVDLSRLPSGLFDQELPRLRNAAGNYPRGIGIHRPFGNYCTHPRATATGPPLLLNHYVGSWEAFSYRDDVRKGARRSYPKWKEQAEGTVGGINDLARPWIQGFVNMVGPEAARELLRDAGLPRNYTKPANESDGWGVELVLGDADAGGGDGSDGS
jgi:hypothetical protein